ncbi:MAG TPA: DUF421 domain-containing protein [Candidatus Dorea intestinavium]|nr:DUF421 domain-containing protein [Candidatus Dorea intestinavium]
MDFLYYAEIFKKLIVTIFLLLIYTRLSGLKQLAPTTAFDSIGNMVVGAVAGTTLLNTDIKVIDSAVFIVIWMIILFFIRIVKQKSSTLKNLIDGIPIALIEEGRLLPAGFKKANISNKELESLLRAKGVQGVHQIESLYVEPNGSISYHLKGDGKELAVILVDQGVIHQFALEEIGKDEKWLMDLLEKENIEDVKTIFCAEWAKERLWIYLYDEEDADKIKII